MVTEPLEHRYTDAELADIAQQPLEQPPLTPERRAAIERLRTQREFNRKRNQFLLDEGVAAVFQEGRGDGGTVFVQSGGSRDPKDPPVPGQGMLAPQHKRDRKSTPLNSSHGRNSYSLFFFKKKKKTEKTPSRGRRHALYA